MATRPETADMPSEAGDNLLSPDPALLTGGPGEFGCGSRSGLWDMVPSFEQAAVTGEQALVALAKEDPLAKWVTIGAAYSSLQDATAELSGGNRSGAEYNGILKELGILVPRLYLLDKNERDSALWLYRHSSEVASWYAGISDRDRIKWSQPASIRRAYERRDVPRVERSDYEPAKAASVAGTSAKVTAVDDRISASARAPTPVTPDKTAADYAEECRNLTNRYKRELITLLSLPDTMRLEVAALLEAQLVKPPPTRSQGIGRGTLITKDGKHHIVNITSDGKHHIVN